MKVERCSDVMVLENLHITINHSLFIVILSRGMGFSIFHPLNLPFAGIFGTCGNCASDCRVVTAFF